MRLEWDPGVELDRPPYEEGVRDVGIWIDEVSEEKRLQWECRWVQQTEGLGACTGALELPKLHEGP